MERPKRQRVPPTQFVAGPASGRVADPAVQPGVLHSVQVPRTTKAAAAQSANGRAARGAAKATKAVAGSRQKGQGTSASLSKPNAPPGFRDSMGSPGFGKSPLSYGIMQAAMSAPQPQVQPSRDERSTDVGEHDSIDTDQIASDEPSRDGYVFKPEDSGPRGPDFTGATFAQPPELPSIATNTAEAETDRSRFFEYLGYIDAIAHVPNVEQEDLCFKCYMPTDNKPAESGMGAAAEVANTRVYDAQWRRYKCFHAKCLDALPADKRNSIIAAKDPWGVCDDEKCRESKLLLRCKTCPAAFCPNHVPAYVIGLQSGIFCGVCIQRLQSGGQDFQKGSIGDRGRLISKPLSSDAALPPQSNESTTNHEAGETSAAPSTPLSDRPRRDRKVLTPQEAPGVDGAPQLLSADRKRAHPETNNENTEGRQEAAADSSTACGSTYAKTATGSGGAGSDGDHRDSDSYDAGGQSEATGGPAKLNDIHGSAPEQTSSGSTRDCELTTSASNSPEKQKGVPIIKGQIPVVPLGEIVWAKYFKYPWWPSAIPPGPGGNGKGHEKDGKTKVRFLDNMKTGWVPDDKIVLTPSKLLCVFG